MPPKLNLAGLGSIAAAAADFDIKVRGVKVFAGQSIWIRQIKWWGGVRGGWGWRVAGSEAPTHIFWTIFGRTELIISASRAKNCEEFAV